MPFWPFRLRRRKTNEAVTMQPKRDPSGKQPLTERSQNMQGSVSQPTRATPMRTQETDTVDMMERIGKSPPQTSATNQENLVVKTRNNSNEDITALPVSWQLNQSPHLRPADSERAEIPYNFRDNAAAALSTTSVQRTEGQSSKPATLKSKRSTFDTRSAKRRSSTKRKEDYLREEEIRAMSAAMPIPKRPGDGPLRRDSYKRRTFDSTNNKELEAAPATLPENSAANVVEQNGWEVQHFWYNPRPAVRLSSIPAYTLQSPTQPSMPLPRDISQKLKEKESTTESGRPRHRTVGADADELDSNDLRAVLERDAKRREKRDRERQERIDRKLKETTRRPSSGKRRREADKEIEAGVPPVPRPDVSRAQSSIHPALRDEPVLKDTDMAGLGIGSSKVQEDDVENPFRDPVAEHRAETGRQLEENAVDETPAPDVENPFEDTVIETAREVRMSTATTPPLSPVDRHRRSSGRIPLEDLTTSLPPAAASAPNSAITPQVEPRSPLSPGTRRSGSESKDKRGAAWASFFKRGGTQREAKSTDTSFANTSRESMSRQPLPPHLITERVSPFQRSSTGAPTRTMSKFREDLPDAPISPPDSRVQSPELPANAAAIAAAATAEHAASQAEARDSPIDARSDTPVSPVRGHAPMSASLASVDSEGSWLASGGSVKRASQQSGLARSLGSLTRRTPEFNASFEDLGSGADKDAEYVQSTSAARKSAQLNRLSGSATAGATADANAEHDLKSTASVHDSVRRKPTLVHHDPAVRSREGLLSEYTAGESPASSAVKDDSPDDEEDQVGVKLESARSIDYGRRHARQVSAGSAKLLDVAPRRMSATPGTPVSPTMQTPVSPRPEGRLEE